MSRKYLSGVLLLLVLFYACRKAEPTIDIDHTLTTAPIGFPRIPFPDENPYTREKWELGKKLFYERAFSIDYSINCASCHKVSNAFSDNVSLSAGADQAAGTRNAPTLANVAYHPYYTREGGVPTLEMQILVPIQEHNEFNNNILIIADRLNEMPEYVEMSRKAFGKVPDAYVITRALATFERTLISGNSAFDRYSHGDSSTLSAQAKRGMQLFFSKKTDCSSCHSGFDLTNYSFENNGLYEVYNDIGRKRLTGQDTDLARFKVPTLRNIAVTAPYMHDGSINTLYDVVSHYNSGGATHPNKNGLVRPLGLTGQEQADLVAFLQSLTDRQFITNKNFLQ